MIEQKGKEGTTEVEVIVDVLSEGFKSLLDEDRCRELFLGWLFKNGVRCPQCGTPLPERRLARFFAGEISYCSQCHIKFFPHRGTAFHSTNLTYSELVLIYWLYTLGLPAERIASVVGRQKVCVTETLGRFKRAAIRIATRK